MQSEERKNKFTIEELVTIGDCLHNSETAFIAIDTRKFKEINGGAEVLGAVRGSRSKLVELLFTMFLEEEDLMDLMSEALGKATIHKIQNKYKL